MIFYFSVNYFSVRNNIVYSKANNDEAYTNKREINRRLR
jgi:hypothetical protein